MGLFTKMREPVFLKEEGSLDGRLEKLKTLESLLNEEGRAKLHQDMRYLEIGIAGEKNIAFELKNSHMPMYIIHDLFLRDGDLTSQIDYLVVTRKLCFVIECKNLYGDIEIDNQGAFIRTMEFGRQRKREGIYSPITQNQRHMALLKKLRSDQAKGIFGRLLGDKNFDENHRAIVVLANPRTVLNARYARQEVKNQVIRADQLVDYIRETYEESAEPERSDKELLQWARSYLDMEAENETDYLEKYEKYKKIGENQTAGIDRHVSEENRDMDQLIKDLRVYRWKTSQAEGIKPYYIFNDNQMMDLIRKCPRDLQELTMVSGFGRVKAEKYGVEILAILARHSETIRP